MSDGARVWAIVLAAGQSRRMGDTIPKQLLPLPDGRSMAQVVAETVRASAVSGVIVVVPDGAVGQTLSARLRGSAVDVITNPHAKDGQSTSLHVGVQAALARDADACVVVLADQPEMSVHAINAVVQAYALTRAPIIQAQYKDGPGHPVLFARDVYEELLTCTGDEGARKIIRMHADIRHLVTYDAWSPQDVDTKDEYDALLGRCRERASPSPCSDTERADR